ncbi:hypothetical protein, partial [Brooklawnia cerclae]
MSTNREIRRTLDIRERAKRAGSHFFDADTMRFFSSRLLEVTWLTADVARIVTSDRPPSGPRCYSVREAHFIANRATVERAYFDTLATYATAATARRHLRDDRARL